jgi:2-C-methyl-D-erythritol 4-phosphate cytidylyltransferase
MHLYLAFLKYFSSNISPLFYSIAINIMTIKPSNPTANIHAMIVAAGRGSRFGATIPKQYLSLQGQTLLQHSVARLASSAYIDRCLLVIAADDNTAQTLDFVLPIDYTIGGAERWQSVQAGLAALIATGAQQSDLVLIHDAARPAVPGDDIEQVIKAAIDEPYGAILAAPVADTLKQSYKQPDNYSAAKSLALGNSTASEVSYDYVQRTIDRSEVWQAQTPQVFRLGALQQVLAHVAEHQLAITDEASAFEALNLAVRLVSGSRQNIKLTYPDDVILLSAILDAQQSLL